MSDKISLFNIFFKILNFAVFLGIAWYGYRRYLKRSIDETMQKEEALNKGFEELNYMLEGQILELEQNLHNQQAYGEQLQEKVMAWQESFMQQKERKHEHLQQLHERLKNRIMQKSEYINYTSTLKKTIPIALEKAENSLREKFSSKLAQDRFLHEMIDDLEKVSA